MSKNNKYMEEKDSRKNSEDDLDEEEVAHRFDYKYYSITTTEVYEELLKDLHLYEVSSFKYDDYENDTGEGKNYQMDIVGSE